jgi:hypothetical protein
MLSEQIQVNVGLGNQFIGDRPCVEISIVGGNGKLELQLDKSELEDLRRALFLAAEEAERWKINPLYFNA